MKTGDILTATAAQPATGFINHKGIYFEKNGIGYVAHNTPTKKNEFGGNVVIEPADDFFSNGRVLINTQPSKTTVERIEAVAYSFKKKPFNAFSFNCEHFVSKVVKNKFESPQLYFWTFITVIAVAYTFRNKALAPSVEKLKA